MTERDVLNHLEVATKRAASVLAYARSIKVPQSTIWAVLQGTRPLNDDLLKRLGYRRIVRYERLPRSARRSRRPK
jgi:hypothetical protein